MKSKHYELKKKYYELLAADPDYPAWQDFEAEINGKWERILRADNLWIGENNYRHNPLPKKWEPEDGWVDCYLLSSDQLTDDDVKKLQAYATKLSWLREQGGHKFEIGKESCVCYFDNEGSLTYFQEYEMASEDVIYMNQEQAEKWLDMLNNGEV